MTALAKYHRARTALAEAKNADEVMAIRDEALRMQANGEIARDRSMIADAVEIQLRAERRLGEELGRAKAEGRLDEGGRPKTGAGAAPVSTKIRLADIFPKLTRDEAKKLSVESQASAKLAPETFEAHIVESRDKILSRGAKALNPASVVIQRERFEEQKAEMARLANNPLVLPSGRFVAGVADPPWEDRENEFGEGNRHYRMHYPTMTPEEIADFVDGSGRPVADLFTDNAFLELWCTPYHVARGSHIVVLAKWRFTPVTIITWDKKLIGLGNGFIRHVTEHLVLAVRGDVRVPPPELRELSLLSEPRTRIHSQKPDWPQRMIDQWFSGPKVILFPGDDSSRPGWASWGNPHRPAAPAQEAAE